MRISAALVSWKSALYRSRVHVAPLDDVYECVVLLQFQSAFKGTVTESFPDASEYTSLHSSQPVIKETSSQDARDHPDSELTQKPVSKFKQMRSKSKK